MKTGGLSTMVTGTGDGLCDAQRVADDELVAARIGELRRRQHERLVGASGTGLPSLNHWKVRGALPTALALSTRSAARVERAADGRAHNERPAIVHQGERMGRAAGDGDGVRQARGHIGDAADRGAPGRDGAV